MNTKTLNGKTVYVFEDHATAFEAWALERSKLEKPPFVLSLDTHSDNHTAFQAEPSPYHDADRHYAAVLPILSSLDFRDCEAVKRIRERLKHDEHIDAAIRAGIVSHAFVLCRKGASQTRAKEEVAYTKIKPIRPYTYDVPANGIFVIDATCPSSCRAISHEGCLRTYCDNAIETAYLDDRLEVVREMGVAVNGPDVLSEPYILDIDLDYFQTLRAIHPKDARHFYKLIRNSVAITVAQEPRCVKSCRLEGESITSDTLEPLLLAHLNAATTSEIISRNTGNT